ncbi:MAG TPA: isochorismatase family protein [Stackebrandtia sp.]|uniref:isochorismatase family protein n=1 Tax=Stackebrandtia sp. TaxID=2023065 RepID=UPI002D6DF70E|nr:isochorismatase family protein [Stackebrandtia sp.]HZE41267.1 isochorismatase family protein [Stackebrandtia sp.]
MTQALILIDLMERIVAYDLAPHSGTEVVERGMRLAEAFRARRLPVVAVRVERPGVGEQPPGSGFVDGLPGDGDVEIVKGAISAFHQTGLEDRLRELGVTTVVMAGIATNLGVEGTARAANDFGFDIVGVSDAMTAMSAEEHDMSLTSIFARFGTVVTTEEYLAGLG